MGRRPAVPPPGVRAHPPPPGADPDTFHFVEDGFKSALAQAFAAAGGKDVRIGGGPATIRQYLRPRLVDEVHVVIVPHPLSDGERLFDDLGAGAEGYECAQLVGSPAVAHVVLRRR